MLGLVSSSYIANKSGLLLVLVFLSIHRCLEFEFGMTAPLCGYTIPTLSILVEVIISANAVKSTSRPYLGSSNSVIDWFVEVILYCTYRAAEFQKFRKSYGRSLSSPRLRIFGSRWLWWRLGEKCHRSLLLPLPMHFSKKNLFRDVDIVFRFTEYPANDFLVGVACHRGSPILKAVEMLEDLQASSRHWDGLGYFCMFWFHLSCGFEHGNMVSMSLKRMFWRQTGSNFWHHACLSDQDCWCVQTGAGLVPPDKKFRWRNGKGGLPNWWKRFCHLLGQRGQNWELFLAGANGLPKLGAFVLSQCSAPSIRTGHCRVSRKTCGTLEHHFRESSPYPHGEISHHSQ